MTTITQATTSQQTSPATQAAQAAAQVKANDQATAQANAAATAKDEPTLVPRVDITETEAGITLVADLPGVPRDGLALQVDGDVLTLEATVQLDAPEGLQSTYAEVQLPRYRRSFTLSRELDADNISATLRHGVLELHIPRLASARPRRIEVQVAQTH